MPEDATVLAWRIVRRVRDRFIGTRREPTDSEWAEEIEAALANGVMPAKVADDYDAGYEDAVEEMEAAIRRARSDLGRRRRQKSKAKVAA